MPYKTPGMKRLFPLNGYRLFPLVSFYQGLKNHVARYRKRTASKRKTGNKGKEKEAKGKEKEKKRKRKGEEREKKRLRKGKGMEKEKRRKAKESKGETKETFAT